MATRIRRAQEPEFDVIIIGSGIVGALVAYRLAEARHRVLILEAGGGPQDTPGRWAMGHNLVTSPAKTPDSPYCGDKILPTIVQPGVSRAGLQPQPLHPRNNGSYDYAAHDINNG